MQCAFIHVGLENIHNLVRRHSNWSLHLHEVGHPLIIFSRPTWTNAHCLIMLQGRFIPSKSQQSNSSLWCHFKWHQISVLQFKTLHNDAPHLHLPMAHESHAPITPNFPSSSSRGNCWKLCWEVDVGSPLFTLLRPEMPTDGARNDRCDQPLSLYAWR